MPQRTIDVGTESTDHTDSGEQPFRRAVPPDHAAESSRLPEAVTSQTGKLVVLYVKAYGGPTVDQLAADLGVSEVTVMIVVERLVEREVLRVDDGAVAMARR